MMLYRQEEPQWTGSLIATRHSGGVVLEIVAGGRESTIAKQREVTPMSRHKIGMEF
jgi:hypothetical protein